MPEVTKTTLTPRQRPKAGHTQSHSLPCGTSSTATAAYATPASGSTEVDAFGSRAFVPRSAQQPVAARSAIAGVQTARLISVGSSGSSGGLFWDSSAAPASLPSSNDPFGSPLFTSAPAASQSGDVFDTFDPRGTSTVPATKGADTFGFGDDFNPRGGAVAASTTAAPTAGKVDAFGCQPFDAKSSDPFECGPFVPAPTAGNAAPLSSGASNAFFNPRASTSPNEQFGPPASPSKQVSTPSTAVTAPSLAVSAPSADEFVAFALRHGPPATSDEMPRSEGALRRQSEPAEKQQQPLTTDAFGAVSFGNVVEQRFSHRRVSSDVTAAIVQKPDAFGAVPFGAPIKEHGSNSPRAKSLSTKEDRDLIGLALQQNASRSTWSKPQLPLQQQTAQPAQKLLVANVAPRQQGGSREHSFVISDTIPPSTVQQANESQRSKLLLQRQRLLQQKQHLQQQQQQQQRQRQSHQQQAVPFQQQQQLPAFHGLSAEHQQQASVFANPLARSASPQLGARLPPGQAAALSASGVVVASPHLQWGQGVPSSSGSTVTGLMQRQQAHTSSSTIGNAYFAF